MPASAKKNPEAGSRAADLSSERGGKAWKKNRTKLGGGQTRRVGIAETREYHQAFAGDKDTAGGTGDLRKKPKIFSKAK